MEVVMATWVRKDDHDRWRLTALLLWVMLVVALVTSFLMQRQAFDRGERAGWTAGWNAAHTLAERPPIAVWPADRGGPGGPGIVVLPSADGAPDCGSDCCTHLDGGAWGPCPFDTPPMRVEAVPPAVTCGIRGGVPSCWPDGSAPTVQDWEQGFRQAVNERCACAWSEGYAQAREDWKAQGWECVAAGRATRR